MRSLILCTIIILSLSACGGLGTSSKIPYDMMMANEGYEELINEKFDQAEAFFDVARSVNPSNPYVLINLGVVYQNTGRNEAAKAMYREVIKLNPSELVESSTDIIYKGKTLTEIAILNLNELEKKTHNVTP